MVCCCSRSHTGHASGYSRRKPHLDQPYIDVISVDHYHADFDPGVKGYYDWFTQNRATPQQQLALVPATAYQSGHESAGDVANRLQGYFDYANYANQSCALDLGGRGITGNFDGCPIWIVAGWLAGNSASGYVGELDASAAPIAASWSAQLQLPLRPDLAHPQSRGAIVNPTLRQLLLN